MGIKKEGVYLLVSKGGVEVALDVRVQDGLKGLMLVLVCRYGDDIDLKKEGELG